MNMGDDEFISFVKDNSKHFKKCAVSICIYGKIYEFNVASITDDHVKLQCKFDFNSIFYSHETSVEYSIKRIIDEDGMHEVSNSYALSQRAITRRNLKGISFSAPVENSQESFKINLISKNFLFIERIIGFDEIKDSKNGLSFIVKNELLSFKPDVDEKLRIDEEKRLKKEELRRKKQKESEIFNRVYSEYDLVSAALFKKVHLKRDVFPVEVMGKEYLFNIDGVGEFAVKLGLSFSFEELFNAAPDTIEEKVRNVICSVLDIPSGDEYEFTNNLNRNAHILDYNTVNLLIGDSFTEFTLITYTNIIRLIRFVRYEHMMTKFELEKNCLETMLKKHIEVFKPKPFSYESEFTILKDYKKEYNHPTTSDKEDPDLVRKKIMEKQKLRKKHENVRSYNSINRNSDMNKILR